jgi:PKD repeat protein
VRFTDLSKNAVQWNWDFRDGTYSGLPNPTHTFSVAGTYTVNLTVSNANGTNSKNASITVLVQPVLPVANFSSNFTQGYAPLSVQFTDLSSNTVQWNWNFGDGTYSALPNPTHTYSAAGKYTVNLRVTNNAGNNTATKSNYITVLAPKPPVANFRSSVMS